MCVYVHTPTPTQSFEHNGGYGHQALCSRKPLYNFWLPKILTKVISWNLPGPLQVPNPADAQVPYIKWQRIMHTKLALHISRSPTADWKYCFPFMVGWIADAKFKDSECWPHIYWKNSMYKWSLIIGIVFYNLFFLYPNNWLGFNSKWMGLLHILIHSNEHCSCLDISESKLFPILMLFIKAYISTTNYWSLWYELLLPLMSTTELVSLVPVSIYFSIFRLHQWSPLKHHS